MTTKLSAPLRREVAVVGDAYTLTITPEGLKLVRKGRRKGHELTWRAIVGGDAALAAALNASLRNDDRTPSIEQKRNAKSELQGKRRTDGKMASSVHRRNN